MNFQMAESTFIRADFVDIPDIYYRKMYTGIDIVDTFFQGIIPGSIYTVNGTAGTGKTTLLLQILNGLAKQGFTAGYASCEEYIHQLAFTCKRLKVDSVFLANISSVEYLAKSMEELDVLVVDSFTAARSDDENLTGKLLEQYKIDILTRKAKETECALFLVLHNTKNGNYKGTTDIVHAVDGVISVESDEEDPSYKVIAFQKYRFGSRAEMIISFGEHGYDFNNVRKKEDNKKTTPKKEKWIEDKKKILQMKEPPHITIARVCKELNMETWKANNILRQMVQEGKLEKFGRGDNAVWKVTYHEETN